MLLCKKTVKVFQVALQTISSSLHSLPLLGLALTNIKRTKSLSIKIQSLSGKEHQPAVRQY